MRSKLICVLIALCSIVLLSYGSQLKMRKGNLYLFSIPEMMTWHSAMQYCRNNSMELVDIPSEMENNVILQLIKEVGANYNITGDSINFWTSGSDLAETGYFYWATNGRSFNFTYWAVGQPSNWQGREHCVQYWGIHNFKWNDENCNSKLYAICNNHTVFSTF